MSFHADALDSGVIDTDPLVLAPVIRRVGAPVGTIPEEAHPALGGWAPYLIHAAASMAARGVRAGTDVALRPVVRRPERRGATLPAVLERVRACTDPAGIEGSDLSVWFQAAFPRLSRSVVNNALIRLEEQGLIQSLPSPLGGNRKRFRALES